VILQTALFLQSPVFWDVMARNLLEVNWRFRGTCHFHLHGGRVSPARNQHEADSNQCWIWRWHAPPKRRFNFNGLHGSISRKTELLLTTAVRTSDPTDWSWRSFYWKCKYHVDKASNCTDAALYSWIPWLISSKVHDITLYRTKHRLLPKM
jgi:hypothetical protein